MIRTLLALVAVFILTPSTAALAWQTAVSDTPPVARPFAVAVDATGDVVAAGRTVAGEPPNDDALVVKLSGSDGTELWQRSVAGAGGDVDMFRAVATATSGIVAVGRVVSETTAGDALLAKYAADGSPVWQMALDGGAGLEDDALAVAVDGAGDVLVATQATPVGATATRFTVRKRLSADGTSVWSRELAGEPGTARAVVVDGSDVVAAGDVAGLIVVTRLDGADGMPDWRTDVAGSTAADDVGRALAVGGGRVVVAGRLVAADGTPDFAVVALDAATGMESWRRVLDGTIDNDVDTDDAFGVAVDAAGDVLAVGRVSNADTDDDLLAVKLAGATGVVLWTKLINGGNDNADFAQALALDGAGDLLVTGTIRNPVTRADFLLLKLANANGAELWRRTINGTESEADQGLAIAAAGSHVVSAGRLRNGEGDGFVVVKLTGANGGNFPCADGMPDAGEDCDDGNVDPGDGCRADCTVEVCGDGIHDPQEGCDDGNTVAGDCCGASCAVESDGTACDDADNCTLDDVCEAGACVPSDVVVCPVPSTCHTGTCDPADGTCTVVSKPEGAICDDGSACTVLDRCLATVCTGTIPQTCVDDEPCTADGCDPPTGCTFTPLASFASVTCTFERDDIDAGCGPGVPRSVQVRISKVRRLVERAAAASRPARARRALKLASKALKQALKLTAKQLERGKVAEACATILTEQLGDIQSRTDGLRAELQS